MRSTVLRAAFAFVALLIAMPGCDGGGDMEKPGPKAEGAPDMSAMPGYNDMQDKMKKGGKAAPKAAPKADEKATPPAK